LMRGSKLEGGGAGWRRRQAQCGNSSLMRWADAMFASNMNSSTMELVSLHKQSFNEKLKTRQGSPPLWYSIEVVQYTA
jgi:hypothetical protein